ncbi:hypothetical protein Tco_1217687 [Tanacetum coccineum]
MVCVVQTAYRKRKKQHLKAVKTHTQQHRKLAVRVAVWLEFCGAALVFIPSSSSSGGSSSKDVDPAGALYPGVVKEVEAGDEPMSKDMKGRLGVDERGGWKGAVGRRRWGPVALGLPPDGKITGGTVNSFLFDMVMVWLNFGDLDIEGDDESDI